MSPGLSTKAGDWTVVNDVKKMTFNKLPDGAKAVAVKRVIVNQDYNPKNFTNDVALMELAEPLAATPIKMQLSGDPKLEENRDITVTGWGLTRWIQRKTDADGHPINDEQGHGIWVDGETGERVDPLKVLAPDLQKVTVPLVAITDCAQDFEGGNGVVDQRNLCAGPPEGGHDTCQGDSGGPVMAEAATHEWRQVGIVSWGPIHCAMAGHPSVFTRVSAFAGWIQQHMGGGSNPEPTPTPEPSPTKPPPSAGDVPNNPAGLTIAFDKGAEVDVGDRVAYVATTQQPGYLTIFDATPDGKLTQVFPTAASLRSPTGGMETTRLDPSHEMQIPNYRNPYRGFDVVITEPRGDGAIVAVLSEQPLKSLDTPKSMKVYDKASGLALLSRLHDELANRMRTARDDAHPPYSMAISKYRIH
jgi:hypothetical protein